MYTVTIRGQQKHITKFNNKSNNIPKKQLIQWIELVRGDESEEDYPVEIPTELGQETYSECGSDYYITITKTA